MLHTTQPNIAGLGRQLHPDLDLWAVAKPELEVIMREKNSFDQTAQRLAERLPGWIGKAPEMPGLIHEFLRQATSGQLRTRLESADLDAIRRIQEQGERTRWRRATGGTLFISGALLFGLQAGPWLMSAWSIPGMLFMAIGALLLWRGRS
jgi:ubiquinone biosynthesis protein